MGTDSDSGRGGQSSGQVRQFSPLLQMPSPQQGASALFRPTGRGNAGHGGVAIATGVGTGSPAGLGGVDIKRPSPVLGWLALKLVGAVGFEPTTSTV